MSTPESELPSQKEKLVKKEDRSVSYVINIAPSTEKHLIQFCAKQRVKGNLLTVGDLIGSLADQFAKSKECK